MLGVPQRAGAVTVVGAVPVVGALPFVDAAAVLVEGEARTRPRWQPEAQQMRPQDLQKSRGGDASRHLRQGPWRC